MMIDSPTVASRVQWCRVLPLVALLFLTGCTLTKRVPPPTASAAVFAQADPAQYLAPLHDELIKTWPESRTINIVCHGHSVPSGYFRTPRVDTFNAYPHLLHVAVKERYPNAVVNVIVTGIGGEASPAGAARFQRDVLGHRPDLITIDYALNDRGPGLEPAEEAWESMIRKAKRSGIPVILLTPTADLRADLANPDDPLNRHAEQVRQLAAKHGVGLADSLAAFKSYASQPGQDMNELMSQGNHPNRAGHDLVVGELIQWFAFE